MPQLGFDTEQYEASRDFGIIPQGRYLAMITHSEERTTQSGGTMLVFEHTLIDGEHANRKVWANCNVVNASEKAEQIGREQVKAIAAAVGVRSPRATEELHGKPLMITVGIEKGKDGYQDKNVVKGWAPAEGITQPPQASSPPPARAARPAPAASAPPPAAGGRPAPAWARPRA